MPRDHQCIAAQLHCFRCVPCNRDRAYNLAAVGMNIVDKPGFTQGIINNGNFFFNGNRDIFSGTRAHKDLIDAKRLVRHFTDLPDVFSGFFRIAARDGKNAEASCIADG